MTAYCRCRNAEVAPGSTVVIVGLGPIGLMAVECAFVLVASRVFAVDLLQKRRLIAEQLGAIALHPDVAFEEIRELTGGRMAECAIEAVGLDATSMLR